MRTLYLRNVPDETVAGLESLARRAGMSVNALAVKELGVVARRAANPGLLADLADFEIDPDEVVAGLESGRSDR